MQRVNSRASGEKHILVALFSEVAKGELVSYDRINAAIGRDLRENRAPLMEAFKALKKQGLVFDNVPRVGYKRVLDHELVGLGDKHIGGIRKRAARACDEMRTADLSNLDQPQRLALAARSGLCAAIEQQTTHKALQRAEEAATRTHAIAAAQETLAHLKS